ncbi:mandelate racemase/muconate lactonizing enzyme family protein [Aquisphaera insulae]|uniref:mandelate racemase/muconate lactonizing enzyme family protein n=1 Tax=Aquisphaera insulae TaxID=2712864 RepID=UPI0013E9E16F|nr:mandelate racemase/muconate lactonizing enzyme family protein [Aquisphaera insulae]
MAKDTDIRPVAASLYLVRIENRVPLKFGPEITTEVTCARVCVTIEDRKGRRAEGWGETPLSVAWVWPGSLSYSERHEALRAFTGEVVGEWIRAGIEPGHPLEVGHEFLERVLPRLLRDFNRRERSGSEPVPWLAALVCASALDLAIHDAYGILHDVPTYETYTDRFLNRDLSHFLEPVAGSGVDFRGRYPDEFLVHPRPDRIPAWHLVGGKDPVTDAELTGDEPDDGYPVLLRDWIRRDGLKCLKVKLRGDDAAWDFDRLVAVGEMAIEEGVAWLSADFNCTVRDPEYVVAILDRLLRERPRIYAMTLYVEQPFPYDLEAARIDVRPVAARKPLFLDESAHDWRMIRLGRELGWSGVALKTCKTQTGAILSLCWARAHGMTLMVQDLTNPMLAQVSHAQLAAHAGTIMGVETNGMQFYPEASRPEAAVHPGLYRRRGGEIDLSTVHGPGFGYRVGEIERMLPEPVLRVAR